MFYSVTLLNSPISPGNFLIHSLVIFFFLDFIYFIFWQRGRKAEREGENINVWLSLAPPNGNMVCNQGMWPDWESNQQPFGSQASAQST